MNSVIEAPISSATWAGAWSFTPRGMAAAICLTTNSSTARRSRSLERKWCCTRPADTPADAATDRMEVAAKPRSAASRIAASRMRAAAVRSSRKLAIRSYRSQFDRIVQPRVLLVARPRLEPESRPAHERDRLFREVLPEPVEGALPAVLGCGLVVGGPHVAMEAVLGVRIADDLVRHLRLAVECRPKPFHVLDR